MDKALRDHLRRLGAKGGKVMTERKRRAILRNLARARAARKRDPK